MKRFLDSRWGLALLYIVIGILAAALLSALCCLIPGVGFWNTAQSMYLIFFAPTAAIALLLILTPIDESLTYGFGIGLYYGTAAIAAATLKLGWYIPDWDRLLLSFAVTALICYIVWLKKFK